MRTMLIFFLGYRRNVIYFSLNKDSFEMNTLHPLSLPQSKSSSSLNCQDQGYSLECVFLRRKGHWLVRSQALLPQLLCQKLGANQVFITSRNWKIASWTASSMQIKLTPLLTVYISAWSTRL